MGSGKSKTVHPEKSGEGQLDVNANLAIKPSSADAHLEKSWKPSSVIKVSEFDRLDSDDYTRKNSQFYPHHVNSRRSTAHHKKSVGIQQGDSDDIHDVSEIQTYHAMPTPNGPLPPTAVEANASLPQKRQSSKRFEIPPPREPPCDLDETTLKKYAAFRCPPHLIPKSCKFRPLWDDSPVRHDTKPKLRPMRVDPISLEEEHEPCEENEYSECTTICTATVNPPKFTEGMLNKGSTSKMEGSVGVEIVDKNGNPVGHRGHGEVDANGNLLTRFKSALTKKLTLKKPGTLPVPRDGEVGMICSDTTASSKSQRFQKRSGIKSSQGVIDLLKVKQNLAPPSEYYVSSVPSSTSRRNETRSTLKSGTSSSEFAVVPRLVQSVQARLQAPSAASSSTHAGAPMPTLTTAQNTATAAPPITFAQQLAQNQTSAANTPQQASAGNTTTAVGPTTIELSASSSSSGSGSGSSTTEESTTKSYSSTSKTEDTTETSVTSAPEKGRDPCDCFPPLNYAYCPPRSNAFVAPRIRLRDMDKRYSAQIASSEYAKEHPDDGSMTFAFMPRRDFGTSVEFSVEPKKAPIWKTMLRCGFIPIINAGVPPCCLSPGEGGVGDDSEYTDGYDSYDTGDETEYTTEEERGESKSSRTTGSTSKSTSASTKSSTSGGSSSTPCVENCDDDTSVTVTVTKK